eukprot:scaffold26496_cov113-Cylindrotheca_fusiformis.AAC.5
MFSANENLMLRQHKRRIVQQVEGTMPENALDMGTTVMVMQVSCKAPGCVPLETAIIIVFPDSDEELVPGLSESRSGGSYKTKILKPMAEVTQDDVLEALPPAFEGGTRTLEKLCTGARDVMLAQITQLFGEEDDNSVPDRKAMAEYLQLCLQQYIDQNCKPPELGEPFPSLQQEGTAMEKDKDAQTKTDKSETTSTKVSGNGNLVIRRVVEKPAAAGGTSTYSKSVLPQASKKSAAKHQNAIDQALNPMQSSNISRLFGKEHTPGIRQPGCPCCDPDNPSNIKPASKLDEKDATTADPFAKKAIPRNCRLKQQILSQSSDPSRMATFRRSSAMPSGSFHQSESMHLSSNRSSAAFNRSSMDYSAHSSNWNNTPTQRRWLCHACRSSPAMNATSAFLMRLIRSIVWRGLMMVFSIYLLFGSQLRLLWVPSSLDGVFDVVSTVTLAFFVVDMTIRMLVDSNYFSFSLCSGGGGYGTEAKESSGTCAVGSFMFWCDLVSTMTLLWDISFVNPREFRYRDVQIQLDSNGFPVRVNTMEQVYLLRKRMCG